MTDEQIQSLGKQEKDGIDLKKLDEMLDDTLEKETKESLNQWLSEKDAEYTAIQGWAAKNNDIDGVYLYNSMPERGINVWYGHISLSIHHSNLFPDLTWESDPQEVEIIIKRKKR